MHILFILVFSVIFFIMLCCSKTRFKLVKMLYYCGILAPALLVICCYSCDKDEVPFITDEKLLNCHLEEIPLDAEFYIRTGNLEYLYNSTVREEKGKKFYLSSKTEVSDIKKFLDKYGNKDSDLWFAARAYDEYHLTDDNLYINEYLGVIDDEEDIEWILDIYDNLSSTYSLEYQDYEYTILGVFKFKRSFLVGVFKRK